MVNKNDFNLFGENNIIPSVQPTHATSDMYWASQRLGNERIQGAYAYKDLLNQNGWMPLGTDFPVEYISPFKTFYAAVARQDAKGFPADGFQMNNALSREETLRGMTIWAAKAAFEEKEKGSLEKGKAADFIMLDTDLMNCETPDIFNQDDLNKKPIEAVAVEEVSAAVVEEVIEVEEAKPIFTIVEEMPSFPGGEGELAKFLGANIVYPQIAKESGIQGTVYVSFVVDSKGKVTDVRVLRGIGGGCDEEALRVVRMMPSWRPGKQNGQSVRVQFNMPIRFTLN